MNFDFTEGLTLKESKVLVNDEQSKQEQERPMEIFLEEEDEGNSEAMFEEHEVDLDKENVADICLEAGERKALRKMPTTSNAICNLKGGMR